MKIYPILISKEKLLYIIEKGQTKGHFDLNVVRLICDNYYILMSIRILYISHVLLLFPEPTAPFRAEAR